jgi:hypothetical protein
VSAQSVCNFCLQRTEVCAAANAVAICASCLFDSYVALGKADPAWWGLMLIRIVQECPPADGERLAEPLARDAARFFGSNLGALQNTGEAMALRDTTAFWRGAAILLGAIHPAVMTAVDARRAIYAALFAGDFARAAAIEPARTSERADRCLQCHKHVVALLRAAPGSVEAKTQRDLVVELCRAPGKSDVERVIIPTTEAFAHVRAGDAARGLSIYTPFRDDPALRPWHALAIGDALAVTGDAAGARAIWNRIADHAVWEPYWPGRARERLGGTTPYR